ACGHRGRQRGHAPAPSRVARAARRLHRGGRGRRWFGGPGGCIRGAPRPPHPRPQHAGCRRPPGAASPAGAPARRNHRDVHLPRRRAPSSSGDGRRSGPGAREARTADRRPRLGAGQRVAGRTGRAVGSGAPGGRTGRRERGAGVDRQRDGAHARGAGAPGRARPEPRGRRARSVRQLPGRLGRRGRRSRGVRLVGRGRPGHRGAAGGRMGRAQPPHAGPARPYGLPLVTSRGRAVLRGAHARRLGRARGRSPPGSRDGRHV
ncbi:MAG: hypothetical protein AVDCRST_MAG50-930, partial [uncultured Acidimicrobiales bacterium]